MKGFWELVTANLKDIIRDRMSLFWYIGFPLLFILIFGAIFGRDPSGATYHVGLVTAGQSSLNAGIDEAFRATPLFKLHRGTKAMELQALQTGKRSLVVVIPRQPRAPGANRPLAISVYYDPGKGDTAQVLIASVRELLSEVERRLTGAPRLLAVKPMKAEVTKHQNIDYLLPGILAMALMQLGLFGALNFVSLRERKIIRRLGATPVPRAMMLWSEIAVRLLVGLFQTATIVVLGKLVFQVTISGNILAVLGAVILGAALFITLGYFLISFTRTEESAAGLIQLVQFPMMFLAGIFFPPEIMPAFLKPVMDAVPLTYLGDLLRAVMVGLPSVYGVWTDLTVLGGWLLAATVLAIHFFKWE